MFVLFSILFIAAFAQTENEPVDVYFKMYGKANKCFMISEMAGTLVHAHYRLQTLGAGKYARDNYQPELRYELQFPEDAGEEEEDNAIDADGVIVFNTKYSGDYQLCFYVANPPRYDYEFHFYLKLEIGVEAIEYDKIAKTQQLNGLFVIVK